MASLVPGTANKIFLAGTLTDGGSDAGISAIQNKFDEAGWKCSVSASDKGAVLVFPEEIVICQERMPPPFEELSNYHGSLIKLSAEEGLPNTVLLSRPKGPASSISYKNQANFEFDSERKRLEVYWCRSTNEGSKVSKFGAPSGYKASDFSSIQLPNGSTIARLGKYIDSSAQQTESTQGAPEGTVPIRMRY